MVYPKAHHQKWNAEIGLGLGPGAVGENFTVAGLVEETVHLGDQYEIGEARVEVSQPRQPCWKPAKKWNRPGPAEARGPDRANRLVLSRTPGRPSGRGRPVKTASTSGECAHYCPGEPPPVPHDGLNGSRSATGEASGTSVARSCPSTRSRRPPSARPPYFAWRRCPSASPVELHCCFHRAEPTAGWSRYQLRRPTG